MLNGFTGFAARDSARSRAAAASHNVPSSEVDFEVANADSALRMAHQAERFARQAGSATTDRPDTQEHRSFNPDDFQSIPPVDRRWAWVEVDLSAIAHNTRTIKNSIGRPYVMAVLNADAYGHGAVEVAKATMRAGANYLGVATVQEGIELREALINAPILVLAQPPIESIPLLLGYKIMPSVYTPDFAIAYGEMADAYGVRAPYHLAVNTGMNRIGVSYRNAAEFMTQIGFHRALDLKGTYTHFATADMSDTMNVGMQAKHFFEALDAMRNAGFNPGIVHCANTAAALRYPDVRCDMVRLGLGLYGYHPCVETMPLVDLYPAMSVHARITDVRSVPMSEGVGYGMRYRSAGSVKICTVPIGYADGLARGLSGKTGVGYGMRYRSAGSVKICTVPIGYADGLARGLSGKTGVIYQGQRLPQVGMICMDQCMFEVDLRSYASRRRIEPTIGDEVLLVGREGDAEMSIEEMCRILDTVPYELCSRFSDRLPRIYR